MIGSADVSYLSVLDIHTLLDKIARRLGEEEQASTENNRPEKLNGNRNPVGTCIEAILSCVNDTIGEKDANSNAELVS